MECRICQSTNVSKKISYKTPINHNYLLHPEDACKYYQFDIYFCHECGFIYSPDYIQSKDELYENYFTLSAWKPQPHTQSIVARIKNFLGTPLDSKIIEVGCNDGSFLDLLVENGYRNVIGIEPTKDASSASIKKSHQVINNFLTSSLVDDYDLANKFDIVTSRHVIEHIIDLDDFLQSCRKMLKPNGVLILELPDHGEAIKYLDFSFWEEHVNYFTYETIHNLLQKNGLTIFATESTLFTGTAQIHYIKRSEPLELEHSAEHLEKAERYLDNFDLFSHNIKNYVQEINASREIICFGGGCRLTSLINIFQLQSEIKCFVDDNIHKVGKFLPMSQLEIQPSSILKGGDYHVILGVNGEIEGKIIRRFNLQSYCSFLPPSLNLPNFWTYN